MGVLRGRISVDNYRDVTLDASTRTLVVIGDDEHHIHEGSSFHAEYSLTTANSDDDVTGILFKTPNTSFMLGMRFMLGIR